MTLAFTKSVSHTCDNQPSKQYTDEELKDMMLQLIERNGIDRDLVQYDGNGTLSIKGEPNLQVHSLMLQAEEMGLRTKYTKQTLIEIAC
ncbi:MAG: hypothetical protein AAFY36_15740 [Bacteroidota bacterium]